MTKRKVIFEIECGEKTCASKPGAFCHYFGTQNFGQQPVCLLFRGEEGQILKLKEKDGWVQRCDPCLEATTPTEDNQ